MEGRASHDAEVYFGIGVHQVHAQEIQEFIFLGVQEYGLEWSTKLVLFRCIVRVLVCLFTMCLKRGQQSLYNFGILILKEPRKNISASVGCENPISK